MNLRRVISGLVATMLLIPTVSDAQTRNRFPSGVASLAQMGCQNINERSPRIFFPGIEYTPINQNIPVGRTVLTAVAYLNSSESLTEIWCNLRQPDTSRRFKSLRLAFGFDARDEQNRSYQAVVVKFSLARDEEPAPRTFYLRMGDKRQVQIDIINTRILKMEIQCTGYPTASGCPRLYFFEDSLR